MWKIPLPASFTLIKTQRRNNCIPHLSPTLWECVTVFWASPAHHRLMYQHCPHTHTHTFIFAHITVLWQHVLTVGLSLFYKHTHKHHSRHYSTELSFVQSGGDGLIAQQRLWPSSDAHSKSAMPCFCRHKQERLPAGCIIQTWLARWMNNQLAEVKWGEGADSNNEIISCVPSVWSTAHIILIN